MFSLNQEKVDTQENLTEQQHALETSIAKYLVSDYEDVEELEFTGWGHSTETGSWGTIVIINKEDKISFSFDGLSDLKDMSGIVTDDNTFKLVEKTYTDNIPQYPISGRINQIEKTSLEGVKVTYSNDNKGD
ncbi:hypothetical protein [Streptococcus marimammalium]